MEQANGKGQKGQAGWLAKCLHRFLNVRVGAFFVVYTTSKFAKVRLKLYPGQHTSSSSQPLHQLAARPRPQLASNILGLVAAAASS